MRSIRISCLLLAGALWAQDAAIQRAVEMQKRGDFEGAAREYRAFLSENPNEAGIHSNLGVVLSQLGRFAEAEKEYREALRLSPGNSGIALNLALAYYKQGRIPEAAKELAVLPRNAQTQLLLADCFLRMGENQKVIDVVQPLRDREPDNLGATYLLGMALIREKRLEEGQKVLDRILRDGNSAETHFLIGSQMFAAGDFPAAVKEFRVAAEKNAGLPSLQGYLGQALLNTGDPDAAMEAFRRELARDPIDFESNVRLAEILIARQKAEEAEPLLQKALLVRPGSAEVEAARHGHLAQVSELVGKSAPGFTLGAVSLKGLVSQGPVLLVFGSYSCPNFRSAAPSLIQMYQRYGKHVAFAMVYIREAHSSADWQSTRNEREAVKIDPATTMAEKSSHAELCVRKLSIPFPAVVDGMDGKVEAAYQAWPSHAYLVDRDGIIRYGTGLTELEFHPRELEAAIQAVVTK